MAVPRRRVTPRTRYARNAVGPGAIPDFGINWFQSPPEIQNLTPGLSTRVKPF